MNATEIKTTVLLTWTSAPVVRIVANVDMPEYGVKARQTVYLVRSSANDGIYYLVVWGDRKATGWSCSCVGNQVYGKCRHCVLANAHSRNRAKRIQAQKASQEQQKKERMVQYRVASFCEAMYCIALEQIVRPTEPVMQVVAANKELTTPLVKVSIKKSTAPLQGHGFRLENGVPMR